MYGKKMLLVIPKGIYLQSKCKLKISFWLGMNCNEKGLTEIRIVVIVGE